MNFAGFGEIGLYVLLGAIAFTVVISALLREAMVI